MSDTPFNPYVGLRPFHADENLLFFGRDEQTLELLQRLHHHRFVAVVGGSGSGKSSLIRAGLIPALKGGYLVEDSSKWGIATMKPGQSLMYNLAETILRNLDSYTSSNKVSSLVKQLKREGPSAILKLIEPLRKNQNINFFLLIDQFEELFRFSMEQKDAAKKTEAIDFVNLILNLSKQREIPFYVVLTMRSDFIGDCAQFRHLPEAMNKSQYLVPRLTREQLKKIIEGPAKLYGGRFNPGLTVRLINDLGKVKDELPLVQHALMRIWDHEMHVDKSRELDHNDYQSIGGIEHALSNHADEALGNMNPREIVVAKEMFQALTAVDENGRKIRRPLLLSDLKELTGLEEAKLLTIIDQFILDQRSFLIVENAGDSGDKVIDISHESLIRQWQTLNEWVDEENEAASYYLQLADATRLNKEGKKDFLMGSELQLALEWQEKFKPTAVWANRYREGFVESTAYLAASKKERTRLQNIEKSRRKKLRILIFSIMGLIALFAVYAVIGRNNAIKKEKTATDINLAFDLHFKAKVLESKDPTTALRLEEEAIKLYKYPEFNKTALARINNHSFYKIIATDSLGVSDIDISPISNAIVAGHDKGWVTIWGPEGTLLTRFQADDTYIYAVLFTQDGKSVITGSFDGIVRIWDLQGRLKREFIGHSGPVTCLALTPDGKSILSGSIDKTIRMWDLEGNPMGDPFKGHSRAVQSVVISPDGKSILSGSFDKKIHLWDLNGNLLKAIEGKGREIYSVAFAPDGESFLTGSWDTPARLYNLKGDLIRKFDGHWGTIFALDFAPDGKSVLTCSFDNTIRLWDIKGGLLKEFLGHNGQVNTVAFTPDGKSIISGSKDGTIRTWGLDGVTSAIYNRHDGAVRSVAFSPDGTRVLTGSNNNTQLWDLKGKFIRNWPSPSNGMTYSAVFAPDGNSILTGVATKTAFLWDMKGEKTMSFKGHNGVIRSVAFAPDGRSILTGSWDQTARLWDLGGNTITEFKTEKGITSVAFAPDGKSVLAGTFGKSLLWNLEGKLLKEFIEPYQLFVNGIAFAPDGKSILTGSNDHSARLWNMQGEIIQEFSGPRGAIRSVAFAPDGRSVLTGAAGGVARIWDLDGNILEEFQGNDGTVFSVDYAPDGQSILIGSRKTAYLMKRIQLEEFLNNGDIQPLSEAQKKEYGIDQ